jgi:toxin ParE1/3/4
MSLAIQKSDDFIEDFELRFRWYAHEGGWAVAMACLPSVHETLDLLAARSGLGRVRRFQDARLRGIRSFRVDPAFNRHLTFYRHDTARLFAERVLHGARDLPRRLLEPPGA